MAIQAGRVASIIGHDDMEACFVFFSTFEELKLPATGSMDRATTKLYEPFPTPIRALYVAPCNLMLGRVLLLPCFLPGDATPNIAHMLQHLKGSAFLYWAADAVGVVKSSRGEQHVLGP